MKQLYKIMTSVLIITMLAGSVMAEDVRATHQLKQYCFWGYCRDITLSPIDQALTPVVEAAGLPGWLVPAVDIIRQIFHLW